MFKVCKNSEKSTAEATVGSAAFCVPTPDMMEQSLLLWRVRKELLRLKKAGDRQAVQAMLEVVGPVLDLQQKARKAREQAAIKKV